MPITSKVMIAFGTLMILSAIIGWSTDDAAVRSGIAVGMAMIGSGGAAAQRRSSLRKTGLLLGLFLPVISFFFYGWQAVESWTSASSSHLFPAVMLSCMSVLALITLLALMKLRSGDNIAERGYSVMPVSTMTPDATEKQNAPQR